MIMEGHIGHVATEVTKDVGEKVTLLTVWYSKSITSKPMKALGMAIWSHMRPRTSNTDSEDAMVLTMAAMSLWMDRCKSSRHSVSWMELVMEEPVEVMVLRKGLMT